jgi:hypothetical protein
LPLWMHSQSSQSNTTNITFTHRHPGAAEPGGNGGMCPPPSLSLKVKKCPFTVWVKVPHLKNEKSISWMNALFCWKESALFAVVKTNAPPLSKYIRGLTKSK